MTRESNGHSSGASALLQLVVRRLVAAGMGGVRALHAALGLYLSLSLGLAALALWGFAELADDVLEGETARFDRGVVDWIAAHRTEWLDWLALELTAVGSAVVLVTIGLIVSVLLWHLGRRRHVALVWIAAAGGAALNQVMKLAFGRERPAGEALVRALSLSFPSGHAMNATIFYTVIAYTVGRVVGRGG
ncbi:MAG TPA: phosphatase PAP2 family protein, partial [Longimicrobiales bacterium]|nr:phosphatase PAP2 family protein [Longimicrobiales bacterium]